MPIFNTEVKTLVSRLQLNVGQEAFNMYDFMDCATLDVVCRKCPKYKIKPLNLKLFLHFRDHSGHSNEHPEEWEHELLECS